MRCALLLILSLFSASSALAHQLREFSPYKPNYFVFFHVDDSFKDPIWKLQFSVKTDIVHLDRKYKHTALFEKIPIKLYIAYTQKSFWDIWGDSSPFREHNFNPEVFVKWDTTDAVGKKLFPKLKIGLQKVQIGLWEHESTGVAGENSRGWDRMYVEFRNAIKSERFQLYLRLWYVAKKSKENLPITDYLSWNPFGGQLISILKVNEGNQRLSIELRRKSALAEIAWKFPFDWQQFYFYTQIWHGYGEGLLSYEDKTTSIGIGVSLIKD